MLQRALLRRRGTPVGTPLRDIYAEENDATRPVSATTFFGTEMEVVLPELVACEIHRHGVIEAGVTALFIEVVRPGTVVYDVGAHLGYYSLLAAALGGRVHAFEPSAETLPILARNVGNGVTIAPVGLWNEDTTLYLKDFGRAHSAVNTFVSPKDERVPGPRATYPVNVITLDRYAKDSRDVPDLIKIDAEGAELAVLQGARDTIDRARPLITMEIGDTAMQTTSRRAIDFAVRLGYVVYDLTDHGLRNHVLQKSYGYGNVLLVPGGSQPPFLPALS